jgi:TRAP-type C4-dicarboxylate transport system permease large subunit
MRLRYFALIWLALVVCWACFGFISGGTVVARDGFYWHEAWGDGFASGVFAAGIATLIVPGSFAVARVRSGHLSRGGGLAVVAAASLLGALVPPTVMAWSHIADSGDASLGRLFMGTITIFSGGLAFLFFGVCVLVVPRKSLPAPT